MSFSLPQGWVPAAIDVPANFTGIVESPPNGKPVIAHNLVLPTPRPDEIIVRNLAVSINPYDWKMPRNYPSPGARIGCELYGEVLAVGPEAQTRRSDIQPGDRICGAVHGANPIDHESGSFCEYLAVPADLVIRLPEGYPAPAASSLGGTSLCTLALALWGSLKLEGTPDRPLQSSRPSPYVLVYGGSTATGTMALQLLRLSGYKPIATCSPHNHELAKRMGAEATFDHRSPTAAADIKAYTRGGLRYVLDIITDTSSQAICHSAIGRMGGIYAALEAPSEALNSRPRTVKIDFVVGLCALGREVALSGDYYRPADPANRLQASQLFDQVQPLVVDGTIKPHPHRVVGRGFDGVIKGIALLEKGVSGERLVVLMDS